MLSRQALCINVHATTRHLATRSPMTSGVHRASPDKGRRVVMLKYNVTWPGAQCCHAGDLFLSACVGGRDQVYFQYTMGEVNISGIYTTKKSVGFVSDYQRKGDSSRSKENVYKSLFN